MNDMTSCLHIRQSLGVYVVGAIDPAERTMVDLHLAGCPECREELAGLAALPALLGRVPFDEAAQIAHFPAEPAAKRERQGAGARPDPEPARSQTLTPLLAEVTQRRRVSRWRNLAAAAAVALVAAGSAAGAVQLAQAPAAHGHAPARTFAGWENARATTPGTNATADVRYRGQPWGTELVAKVAGIKPGTTCQFWVVGAHGQRWSAGSWTVARAWESYTASVAAPADAVRAFQVTAAGRLLVTVKAP
jgi:anti-sigma factor RsiW